MFTEEQKKVIQELATLKVMEQLKSKGMISNTEMEDILKQAMKEVAATIHS